MRRALVDIVPGCISRLITIEADNRRHSSTIRSMDCIL